MQAEPPLKLTHASTLASQAIGLSQKAKQKKHALLSVSSPCSTDSSFPPAFLGAICETLYWVLRSFIALRRRARAVSLLARERCCEGDANTLQFAGLLRVTAAIYLQSKGECVNSRSLLTAVRARASGLCVCSSFRNFGRKCKRANGASRALQSSFKRCAYADR